MYKFWVIVLDHKQQVVYDPKQKHQIIPIVTQRGKEVFALLIRDVWNNFRNFCSFWQNFFVEDDY